MKQPKRLTELSLKKKDDAYRNRLRAQDKGESAYLDMKLAKLDEERAAELIAIYEPPITNMGEVTSPHIACLPGRDWIRNTLPDGDMVAEEASISRTDLLTQDNLDISALAVDAADSIKADNSMEKMLAHQMALAHEMVMKLGNAAMGETWKIQQATTHGNGLRPGAATELQRLTNSVARLMGAYQQGMLTLQKLKTGGNQTVTVQHVNISPGGQAVIGNVQTGGSQPPGGRLING
jgi:hypothetical protein